MSAAPVVARPRAAVWWLYLVGAVVLAMMAGSLIWSSIQSPSIHAAPQPQATFGSGDQDTYTGGNDLPESLQGERVLVPSLGLETPWVEAGMHDGLLDIPSAPTAGWYNQSVKPGSPAGTTIIAAHVDYPDQTLTPFGHLAKAQKGAPVFVVGDGGKVYEYKITALDEYSQTALPASLFTRSGDPKLVLITCAGKSLPESARAGAQWAYESSLVVTAKLIGTR